MNVNWVRWSLWGTKHYVLIYVADNQRSRLTRRCRRLQQLSDMGVGRGWQVGLGLSWILKFDCLLTEKYISLKSNFTTVVLPCKKFFAHTLKFFAHTQKIFCSHPEKIQYCPPLEKILPTFVLSENRHWLCAVCSFAKYTNHEIKRCLLASLSLI